MLSVSSDSGINQSFNFLLPKANVFGFCDNYKSAQFLEATEHDSEACMQQIKSLDIASKNFLDPNFFIGQRLRLSDISSLKLTQGKVFITTAAGAVTSSASLPPVTFD